MIAIFKKEMLEIVRTKKLLIMIIVFVFIGISSPIIAKLIPALLKSLPATPGLTINLPDPTWRDAIDQFVKNAAQIAVIVLVFVFAGVISEEKNKKTLEILLTKPVSRAKYILSKYLAAFLSMSGIYIVCSLVFYTYSISIFGNFSFANFALMSSLVLIYLSFVVATAILCSTFSKSNIVAAFIAFGIQIGIVSIMGLIPRIAKYLPGQIIGNYKDFFTGIKPWDYLPATLVAIGLIVLCIIISILIFKKQEIER